LTKIISFFKLNFYLLTKLIHFFLQFIIGNAQQHRAQIKQNVLYAFSYKFKLCKAKLFQNCYLSSTFVLKLEPNPNLVLQSELNFFENNSFWEKKRRSGVGGLTSSLPFQTRLPRIGTRIRSDFQNRNLNCYFFKNHTRTGFRVPFLCGTRTILMFI
jgi:hypothetical protein